MIRRRALLTVLVLSPVLAGAGPRTGWVLPPDAQAGFQRFMNDVNAEKKLGAEMSVAGVSLEPQEARLTFRVAGSDVPVVLVLTRVPPAPKDRTRWFAYGVTPAAVPDGFTRALPAIVRLLDAAFPSDPWVLRISPTSAEPLPPETQSLSRALAGYGVVALLALLSLGMLVAAKPKTEGDRP